MIEETYAALILSVTPGLGRRGLHELLRHCKTPSRICGLNRSELKRVRVRPEARASLVSGRSRKLADETIAVCRSKSIHIFSRFDPEYPARLSNIYDPPLILYALGDIRLLSQPAVALVGSRRASVYGRQVTVKLARDLAGLGLCVVSGLARGIDSMAHQGALEGRGDTVAVLGCGVDVIYPRENRKIYRQITEGGCVLSEFPQGSYPAPQNFPVRNRIISGLALGTVICEASEFSGSLITARLTLEQGRELWAIPGNITQAGSYGPNHLIKQGARLVVEAQDVLEDLPLDVLQRLQSATVEASAREAPVKPPDGEGEIADERHRMILKVLATDRPLHVDELLQLCALPPHQIETVLLELEMENRVIQMPGRRYCRKLF